MAADDRRHGTGQPAAGPSDEALRGDGERLRSVLENMSEGLMLFDAAGNLIYQNPASLRIHGFDPREERIEHEALPATWRAWDHAGRPITFEEWPVSRVFRHERFQDQVLHVQRVETGQEFYASYNGCPIYGEDGRLELGFITIRDISEQVHAQAALAAREEQFRELAEAMPQLVWITRADGSPEYYNRKWCEYTGITVETGQHHAWARILHPDDLARTLERWKHSLAQVEPYEMEYRLRSARTGAYRWFLARAVPVREPSGAIVRWFGTCTDIDEQKLAQERLHAADQRKDEFLGMLSHELRNPLAPIWNSLFVMEHSPPDGERARQAREIVTRQVGHLARLVDDLLDVTRIGRGKIELRRVDLDLAELVRRTCHDYATLMDDRQLELACPAPTVPVWVHGDATRLGQVVGNLLQNAAKFTPPGGRVDLELAREGHEAVFRVRDTGAGIRPELLERIFEPFAQGEQTLARTEGGLGLGLALVKGLVELHGGSVSAASEGPGRGAAFTIRLPVAADAAAADDDGARRPAAAARRRRVLVVDDNVDSADALAQVVALLGHAVDVAHDGRGALDRIGAAPPDVVLCDIGLPDIDGFEVARAVRRAGHGLRLVAVTGYARPEDIRRAAEAGFDAHVAKPPDPHRIGELIE